MAEAIAHLAALGALLALADLIVAEGPQKRGVRFIGGLLTAGAMLELWVKARELAEWKGHCAAAWKIFETHSKA